MISFLYLKPFCGFLGSPLPIHSFIHSLIDSFFNESLLCPQISLSSHPTYFLGGFSFPFLHAFLISCCHLELSVLKVRCCLSFPLPGTLPEFCLVNVSLLSPLWLFSYFCQLLITVYLKGLTQSDIQKKLNECLLNEWREGRVSRNGQNEKMLAQNGEENNGTNEGAGPLGYKKECVREHRRRSLKKLSEKG